MPIEIYWLVEKRVAFCKYMGDVTVDEIRESVEIGVQMIDSLPENIALGHTILDGSKVTSFPRNIKQVNDSTIDLSDLKLVQRIDHSKVSEASKT